MFRNKDTLELCKYIKKMIKKYKLEKNNRESFEKIRELYNSKLVDLREPELLYLLILY
jgi:site-specific DNA-adenine methylase